AQKSLLLDSRALLALLADALARVLAVRERAQILVLEVGYLAVFLIKLALELLRRHLNSAGPVGHLLGQGQDLGTAWVTLVMGRCFVGTVLAMFVHAAKLYQYGR